MLTENHLYKTLQSPRPPSCTSRHEKCFGFLYPQQKLTWKMFAGRLQAGFRDSRNWSVWTNGAWVQAFLRVLSNPLEFPRIHFSGIQVEYAADSNPKPRLLLSLRAKPLPEPSLLPDLPKPRRLLFEWKRFFQKTFDLFCFGALQVSVSCVRNNFYTVFWSLYRFCKGEFKAESLGNAFVVQRPCSLLKLLVAKIGSNASLQTARTVQQCTSSMNHEDDLSVLLARTAFVEQLALMVCFLTAINAPISWKKAQLSHEIRGVGD